MNELSSFIAGTLKRKLPAEVAERARLMQGCRQLGCDVFPSKANFFLVRPPHGVSAKLVYQHLIDKGVSLLDTACAKVAIGQAATPPAISKLPPATVISSAVSAPTPTGFSA